ncbi:MAG: tripartite tricarboxylate transporter TctB family protein [Burkholderiales bacterium]
MSRDGVAGLIGLALSIGMLVLTRGLPHSAFVPVGPEFYPRIVLGIMAALSALLIVSDLWRHYKQPAAAPAAAEAVPEKRNYQLVAITFAIFGVYVALLSVLGYRLSTFLFMLALQPALNWPSNPRRWIMVLVYALAATALTYLVFDTYLSVLLPRGSWTGW